MKYIEITEELAKAINLVLDLAYSNALTVDAANENECQDEYIRQQAALDLVETLTS